MIDSIISKLSQCLTSEFSNLETLDSIPTDQLTPPQSNKKVNINIAVGDMDTFSGENGSGQTPQNITFKIFCIPYTTDNALDMSKLTYKIIKLLYNTPLGLSGVEQPTIIKSIEIQPPGCTYKSREISVVYRVYTGPDFIDPGVPVKETYWSQSPKIGSAHMHDYKKIGS